MKRKIFFQCVIFLIVLSLLFTNIEYNSKSGRVEINLRKNLISVGQYIGYKALTSVSKIKLRWYDFTGLDSLVDTSWDGQSSFVFHALLNRWQNYLIYNQTNHFGASSNEIQPARFVVDIGAHDGIWLSNSNYFLQAGFSGLLVEPNPDTFTELDRTWPRSKVINSSKISYHVIRKKEKISEHSVIAKNIHKNNLAYTTKNKKQIIYLVEAAIGFNQSKGNIFDRSILLDATQSEVKNCDNGSINIIPLPYLLEFVQVPKHFAVLSIDIEWEAQNYVKVLKDVILAGWHPEFLILELRGDLNARASIVRQGYEYLNTMRYDDIFSLFR